ncbi:hypothetical protein [Acidovorax sp. A1169]|uniref:hypothetical protein n=1 Tax=Acidovorax sp. A1169 TaxID=3059524 RepID=UPI002737AE2E|nr:hypothetical protein [Acidovorax sp. A1169]MDP4078912.1 hypothetical protein [Acidovorax sp. A1169]
MRSPPSPMHAGPNAFESVRPRGADTARNSSAHRPEVPAGRVLLFNCSGLRTVGLGPRVRGSICIESRAQSQASLDKSRRIARDWRQ